MSEHARGGHVWQVDQRSSRVRRTARALRAERVDEVASLPVHSLQVAGNPIVCGLASLAAMAKPLLTRRPRWPTALRSHPTSR